MWLPWQAALILAAALFGIGVVARPARRATWVSPCAFEAALVAVLYSAWQIAGRWSLGYVDGAMDRAQSLWDLERAVGLPSESWLQDLALPHSWVVQASNIYYGGAHVPAMGICLIWLFLRHREGYPRWRTLLALSTAGCLVIQLLPVAPPRFLAATGMVDTGITYGQSVYTAFGSTNAGQLQAMPSIHVAWAVLVGWAVWRESGSSWRVIGPAHAVLTMLVVVVTANHFWADGIVAIAILAILFRIDSMVRSRGPLTTPARVGTQVESTESAADPEPITAAMSASVDGS